MNINFPSDSSPRVPRPARTEAQKRRTRIVGIIFAVIAVLAFIGPIIIDTYTDWSWFSAIDYTSVFTSMLFTRIALFLIFVLVAGGIVWLAVWLAYRSKTPDFTQINSPLVEYRDSISRWIRPVLYILPIIVGIVAGVAAQGNWRMFRLWQNAQDFGVQDPEFGKDLGFYAFHLPVFTFIVGMLSVLLIVAVIGNLVMNYLMGNINTGNPRLKEKASIAQVARIQLAVLIGLWFIVRAVSYWLSRYSLLSTQNQLFTGASYTDIHAILPARIIMAIISLLLAALFIGVIFFRDFRISALATGLMVLTSFVLGFAWPALLEQFSVSPNRQEKEQESIERNIAATKYSFGLTDDKVSIEQNWGSEVSPETESKVNADSATLDNIRILDPMVLHPTFTQQQQLQNFYGFAPELSIDRYEVDGKMRDYVIAAREVNPSAFSSNQGEWLNRHTVYTHGNGIVAAPANRVDAVAQDSNSGRGGYPMYTVSDLQTEGKTTGSSLDFNLEQPRVYFSEMIADQNEDYAIVGDDGSGQPREYDTENSKYTYTGDSGVHIGNFFNRAMYSMKFGSMNMLLTGAIGDDSQLLYNRDPRDRVHKVAPWLTTDSKIYPTVIDGRIQWIVDGYTTLQSLPYSERVSLNDATEDAAAGSANSAVVDNNIGYLRNSVKATVDAYSGEVTLYAFDEQDPVLKAWRQSFPDVVKPKSDISDELMEHIRYPQDGFKVQRALMTRYHVNDPGTFYRGNSFWSVATNPNSKQNDPDTDQSTATASTNADGASTSLTQSGLTEQAANEGVKAQPPYYVVAADPESGKPVFQLITAFNGLNREFLSAQMTVTSDPENYGNITVRALSRDTQTFGPKQAQDSMLAAPQVSQERSLWQQVNKVTNGNLLTLPVGESEILYAEPVYTQNKEDGSFPKLLRIMLYYNGRVGYASTVDEALSQVGISRDGQQLVGEQENDKKPDQPAGNENPGSGASADKDAAAKKIQDAWAAYQAAVDSGNRVEEAEALDRLDAVMNENLPIING